jgi:hypothetical protein
MQTMDGVGVVAERTIAGCEWTVVAERLWTFVLIMLHRAADWWAFRHRLVTHMRLLFFFVFPLYCFILLFFCFLVLALFYIFFDGVDGGSVGVVVVWG